MLRIIHRMPVACALAACALMAACASHGPSRSAIAATQPASRPQAVFEPAQPLELAPYPASTRDAYNKSYAATDFQLEPNAFLIRTLDQIAALNEFEQSNPQVTPDPDTTALDIATGNGRNAIPLAQRGYRTVAFDLSDVGVNAARKKAAELGLGDRLHAITADATTYDYGTAQWSIVVMMYYRVSPDRIADVKNSVKPGGYVIMECREPRPGNQALDDFMDWDIVLYQHDRLPRDWSSGTPHSPGQVLRLVARKPKH